MKRFVPASLSARLVVTAVALVAVVSLLTGAAITLAIRSTLVDRLDREVQSSLQRVSAHDHDLDRDDDTRRPRAPTRATSARGR